MAYQPNTPNRISTTSFNSRDAATLAAAATFQGVGEDVSKYGRVGVSIVTDNATDGTLYMEVSRDNATWSSIPRTWSDTRFAQPHMWNIVEKYFRIKYVNGTTEATNLVIQVQYSNNADILLGHQLNETLKDETEAIAVRALGVGQDPLDTYTNSRSQGTAFVTTANVVASATYSSGVLNLEGYTQVQTEILSDKDGTLTFTFSSDSAGTDVVRTISVPYVAAAGYQFFGAPAFVNYVKYEFTNTEVADTTDFYFTTKFLTAASSPQLIRTDGYVAPAMLASLSRSVNHFDLDAARRHVVGQRSYFFFGDNNALQDGVFEDVYAAGGDINWQTTAAKIKIKSTNAADTATGAGVGLQSVEIHGLDSTGAEIEEVLDLNGTTPVESVNSYLRVTLVHNEEVGTYGGSHEGTIEWRVTNATFASGALLGQMIGLEGNPDVSPQYGLGEALNGFTSIPLGKVAYITRLEVVPKTSKPITVILYEREGITTVADPFLPRRALWIGEELQEPVEKEFKSHIKIKALTDLWFRAEGNGQASGCAVSLDYYLVDADASGA